MVGQNIQEKELYVLGTILNCNREIKKFQSQTPQIITNKLNLLESIDIQNAKTLNLFMHCSDITYQDLNENFDSIVGKFNIAVNNRNNYYAYFNKVNKFLLESRNADIDGIFTSLNESLTEQHNVFSYQEDLQQIIKRLEHLVEYNTINSLTGQLLKIKSWAKSPIYSLGFDLCNNATLMDNLGHLGVNINNLIAICFNNYHKQLVFFTFDLGKTLVYDIKTDILDLWNSINSEYKLPSTKVTPNNYKRIFRDASEINDFVELYFNINSMQPKFTDNLYRDITYQEYLKNFENNKRINSLIK